MDNLPVEVLFMITEYLYYEEAISLWSTNKYYRNYLVDAIKNKMHSAIRYIWNIRDNYITNQFEWYCIYCGNKCKYTYMSHITRCMMTKKVICKFGKLHANHYCDCAFGTTKCGICHYEIYNYELIAHLGNHFQCICGGSYVASIDSSIVKLKCKSCNSEYYTTMKIKRCILKKLSRKYMETHE
jgi:ribosomal protein L33